MNGRRIRALILEDRAADARLMVRHLEEEGFDVRWERVAEGDAFVRALDDGGPWDLILTDYELPAYSAEDALTELEARELDVPFILVTGTIDDDVAADLVRKGAQDFVLKGAMARLGPAASREIREAEVRRERTEARRRYRRLFERSRDGIYVMSDDNRVLEANPALLRMFRTTREELAEGFDPERFYRDLSDRERFLAELREKGFVEGMLLNMRRGDGTPIVVRASAARWRAPDGSERGHQGMLADVTEQTRTRRKLQARSARLRERIKELDCLYGVDEILRTGDLDDPGTWRDLVGLIPAGWQHPEAAEARLKIGGLEHLTSGWTGAGPTLTATVGTGPDTETGVLEVAYPRGAPEGGSDPFLEEERELLDALALRIGESLHRRRAEEELKEREALFRTVTENSADVIVILDEEMNVVFRTPGGPGPLNYDPELMEGVGFLERVHPEDRDGLEREYARWIDDGGATLRTRYRVLHPGTGAIRHVEGAAVNLLDVPAVEGVVVNIRDVTEQRLARERLRFQADLLDAVGQAIIATDLDGKITYWGGGAEDVFGWSASEVLGRDIVDVTPAKETEERFRGVMDRIRSGEAWRGEFEVRRKDGSTFPALVTNRPLHDADGRLEGIVGITTDITELKAAEASRQRSEERFRALIENSRDLVAILDPDGTIVYESPAVRRVLGYGGPEREGAHAFEDSIMHPEDRDEARRVVEEVTAEEGATRRVRFRVRDADGEYRTVEGTLTNLCHVDAVGGVVMNGRDVTEREKLEERLFRTQRLEAVGRLAGGIAHDFNNIMTSIQGFTAAVLDEIPADDAHREDLAEVLRQARRASDLTGQLLAFSRRQMLVPRVLDVRTTIEQMERMLGRLIGEDIRLSVRTPAEALHVRVDPAQLEQVVVNLVVNARDAMPDGGELFIEAGAVELDAERAAARELDAGPYVRLVVEDTGRGMTDETLEHAFEPFFTTKPSGKGTGLGLATVFGVVKQSGGDVRAVSEPGEGARFTILLPREYVDESEVAVAEADAEVVGPAPLPRARSGESVLVAEDDDAVRDLIERILRGQGYSVRVAEDGEAALELVDHGAEPDLLLTDMVMPGIGGGELARRIHEERPGMPVVFMTGYTEDEILRRGISDEEERFVSKPFTREGLLNAVRSALDETRRAP